MLRFFGTLGQPLIKTLRDLLNHKGKMLVLYSSNLIFIANPRLCHTYPSKQHDFSSIVINDEMVSKRVGMK